MFYLDQKISEGIFTSQRIYDNLQLDMRFKAISSRISGTTLILMILNTLFLRTENIFTTTRGKRSPRNWHSTSWLNGWNILHTFSSLRSNILTRPSVDPLAKQSWSSGWNLWKKSSVIICSTKTIKQAVKSNI